MWFCESRRIGDGDVKRKKRRGRRQAQKISGCSFFFFSFSVKPFNDVSTGKFGPMESCDKAVIVDGCRWLSNRPRRSGANDAREWVSRHWPSLTACRLQASYQSWWTAVKMWGYHCTYSNWNQGITVWKLSLHIHININTPIMCSVYVTYLIILHLDTTR